MDPLSETSPEARARGDAGARGEDRGDTGSCGARGGGDVPPPLEIEPLEIRELAERVLFGKSLEEKLVRAGRLTDADPGPARPTPKAPGRPPHLSLARWHSAADTERVSFADVRAVALADERQRGLLLHFFANHELLAAELMALVLLKFPKAPPRFRRGVARTLKDEQEHVSLYLSRMAAVGVEFGQIPVSDFFWRAIAPMPSPMDFVARLSLTLEQANLDYAPYYGKLFGQLGDAQTQALLGRIYRDEIGHVRHGLNWFNAWRAPTQSEWEAFQQVLGFPLSPSRARGIGTFNREGRRRAGLSQAFIDQVEVYARSHGRCPDLWWFNPLCDLAAGRGAAFAPSARQRDLAADLAAAPALLAAPADLVVVPEAPSVPFLQSWKAAGLPLPEWVVWDPASQPPPATLRHRRLTRLHPWGWAPDSAAALQGLAANLPEGTTPPAARWHAARRRLYRKSWSAAWLAELVSCGSHAHPETHPSRARPSGCRKPAGPSALATEVQLTGKLPAGPWRSGEGDWLCGPEVVGVPCAGVAAARQALEALFARGWQRVVIKADFGAAGGQRIVVEAPLGVYRPDGRRIPVKTPGGAAPARVPPGVAGLLADHEGRWLERVLRAAGAVVVVEPWLDRVLDLSAHYDVAADGSVRFLGMTRFLTDGRGRFAGVLVHDLVAGLGAEVKRFLYGEGRDQRRLSRLFHGLGEALQERLAGADFGGPVRGPLSIDALVYRDAVSGALRLKPVVEVNPRHTMGRVGLALGRRVLSGRTAVWRLWQVRQIRAAGFADAGAWAAALRDRLPLETAAGGQITRGVVFTNEPHRSRAWVGALLVARDLESLAEAVAPLPVLPRPVDPVGGGGGSRGYGNLRCRSGPGRNEAHGGGDHRRRRETRG